MAKINTTELAEETGLPTKEVDKVVSQIIVNKNNHKREPKPPPPEGGISLRAAERKYGVKNETLSLWTRKGYLPILLRTRNEVYVSEILISKMANLYKKDAGQGKWTIHKIIKEIRT